eukprot:SAG22_NODE_7_length_40155_cov_25.241356_12_plen_242_part_00
MLAGLANYGSDSDDDDDSVAGSSAAGSPTGSVAGSANTDAETETEDEATPRTEPLGGAGRGAAAAPAPAPPAAPVPPRGARIMIKPAPQVIMGDDPDGRREPEVSAAAALSTAGDGAGAAHVQVPPGGEPADDPLDVLLDRFTGPPVEPDAEAAGALQEKVVKTLTRYHQGAQHYVDYMRTNHAFRNPGILVKVMEKMQLDQYGTEFPPELFHPKVQATTVPPAFCSLACRFRALVASEPC